MFFSIYNRFYKGQLMAGDLLIKFDQIVSILPHDRSLEIILRDGKNVKISLKERGEMVLKHVRKEIDKGEQLVDISRFMK